MALSYRKAGRTMTRWKRTLGLLSVLLTLVIPGSGLFANTSREQAVSFSLNNLSGMPVTLEQYRGQVLLVNFWATWCPPCVHELPSIQALKDNFPEQPFEVLALNMGERGKDIERFLRTFKTKLNFPILLNADLNVAKKWNVRAMPTTLFIDKSGRIAELHIGPKDWNTESVQQQVAALLGE